MSELALKAVVDLGLKTIRSSPDRYLNDIFCDVHLDPLSALYGRRTVEQAKEWILKSKVPVILGFDLNESEMPAVTINLGQSVPRQQAIGDASIPGAEPLDWQDKEVLVPTFVPASAILSDDLLSMTIVPPADLPFEQAQLILPGLIMRDKKNREYDISQDANYNTILVQRSPEAPLSQIDLTGLEVIAPVIQARYSRGGMVFDDTLTVTIHGHSTRQEGLWLYNIVMWSLLRYRPLLEGTFGLAISTPMASDFQKDDMYLAAQIWRRYITVSATTIWTWESTRQKDVLAMLLSVYGDRVNGNSPVKL
jgi:hypothetical protein